MLRQKPDISQESNFEGRVIKLSIDAESMPEVMMLLTDLYPDPEAAVVRELGTNAWDAHVEAGNPNPFRVYKPTPLSPNFVVQDFGTGMDIDDIDRVYTKYGASTRRNSNEFTGTLGMGSKSPMAYAGSLTIRTVKNGWKIVAIMSRNEHNTAEVEIVSHEPCDEANGTTITVPRMTEGDFTKKVDEFYSYWDPSQVLIDDEPPTPISGERLGDSIILQAGQVRNRSDRKPDMIVMGGVPYKVDSRYSLFDPKDLSYEYAVRIICKVKMGSVAFAPSREELIYSRHTLQTLEKLKKEVAGRIKWLIEKQISEAPNHFEACRVYSKWKEDHGFILKDVEYRGLVIPPNWNMTDKGVRFFADRYLTGRGRLNYERFHRGLDFKSFLTYNAPRLDGANDPTGKQTPRIIIGCPYNEKKDAYANSGIRREVTQSAKLKIRLWSRLNGIHEAIICFEHPDPLWLSGLKTIPWETVKETKPPRGQTVYDYSFPDHEGHRVLADDLPADGDGVLYCDPVLNGGWARALRRLQVMKGKDYILVQVQDRRREKFLRNFPKALPIKVVYSQELARLERELLSRPDLSTLFMEESALHFLRDLAPLVILDPVVQAMIKIAVMKIAPETRSAWDAYYDFNNSYHHGLKRDFGGEDHVMILRLRYPLIKLNYDRYSTGDDKAGTSMAKHQAQYMNWWYATHLSTQPVPIPSLKEA